jgi:hypothetical protein
MKAKEKVEVAEERFYRLSAMMINLPYEDEFRKVKVKTRELDEFLKEVVEGKINDSKEFVREGLKRTLTPALLSIIKEKLKIYAEKYKDNEKGEAALMVLQFLYRGLPLDANVFFLSVFIRSTLNRPLADNNRVWNFLYEFLPRKVEVNDAETIEKPKFKNISGEEFEESKSGLLTPKKKELKSGGKSKIIIPHGGSKG